MPILESVFFFWPKYLFLERLQSTQPRTAPTNRWLYPVTPTQGVRLPQGSTESSWQRCLWSSGPPERRPPQSQQECTDTKSAARACPAESARIRNVPPELVKLWCRSARAPQSEAVVRVAKGLQRLPVEGRRGSERALVRSRRPQNRSAGSEVFACQSARRKRAMAKRRGNRSPLS